MLTNLWDNCLPVFAHGRLYRACPVARRQGGSMSASFGRFAGCHGHIEGDVPVNRRWVQWHKQGAVPLPHTRLSQHTHMEGSRAYTLRLTHSHFYCDAKNVPQKNIFHFNTILLSLPVILYVFQSEYMFLFSLWADTVQRRVRLVPYTWQHPAHTLCECCK